MGHCLVPEGLEGHYLVPEIPFSVPVDCSGPVELVAAAAELEAASHLNLGSGSLTSETQLSPLSATSRSVRLCFGAVWVHGAFHTGRSYAIMGLPCLGWVPQEEGGPSLPRGAACSRSDHRMRVLRTKRSTVDKTLSAAAGGVFDKKCPTDLQAVLSGSDG